jgi:molybdate transport system substrate-binding protein
MKKTWLLLLLVLLAVTVVPALSPASASAAPTLKVFAAASLNKAFPDEAKAFKAAYPKYKNVKFSFQFLGTDVLVAQIIQDPTAADVFAGASTAYGDTLANHVDASGNPAPLIKPYVKFCQNRLCVILPKDNYAGITSLADVASKAVDIAVGQASVPIGKYTATVLTNISNDPAYGAAYKTTVQAKSRYLPNVASIDGVVAFGGADAGFVYNSDYKQLITYGVTKIGIPGLYQTSPLPTYPLAATTGAKNPKPAQAFVNYVMSKPGQRILKNWGFLPKPPVTTTP